MVFKAIMNVPKRKVLFLFSPVIAAMSLVACGKPLGTSTSILDSALVGSVDFAAVSANVLQPKCVACHNSGNASGGVDLSSYAALKASNVLIPGSPGSSRLFIQMQSGLMPLGGVQASVTELSLVSEWISEGAPETVSANPPSPLPTPVASVTPHPLPSTNSNASFSWIKGNVIQTHCASCHSAFLTYSGLMSVVTDGNATSSPLYQKVSTGAMPPSGGSLSGASIQAIQDWIEAGALNN